jgi:hypothetical protein
MKKLVLVMALVPALALSAPERPGRPGDGGRGPGPAAALDDATRVQRIQKRMRLALTLGLAEALDLDEPATMRVRDAIAKNAEKRLPLRQQVFENVRVIRSAARGDPAAMGQVDGALGKLRDVRSQLRALDDELLQQVTQGLSLDKKAKAALFLARFHERARHVAGGRAGFGPGPARGVVPGGGSGLRREQHPMARQGSGSGDPDLGDWFADE